MQSYPEPDRKSGAYWSTALVFITNNHKKPRHCLLSPNWGDEIIYRAEDFMWIEKLKKV